MKGREDPPSETDARSVADVVTRAGRPVTRAWSRLVAEADEDAAKAAQLREEAQRYLEANANRRGASHEVAASQLVSAEAEKENTDMGGKNSKPATPGDADTDEEVARLAAELQEKLDMRRPWKERVEAMEQLPPSGDNMSEQKAAAVCGAVAESLASQLEDLRSMVVVAAADTVERVAPLLAAADSQEHAAKVVDAALKVSVKTKAVMATAGARAAEAVLVEQKTAAEPWTVVLNVLSTASHAKARTCAAQCVQKVLAVMEFDDVHRLMQQAMKTAVDDKSPDVRNAAKKAYARYVEKHGDEKKRELLACLSPDARARLDAPEDAPRAPARSSLRDHIRTQRLAAQQTQSEPDAQGAKDAAQQPAGDAVPAESDAPGHSTKEPGPAPPSQQVSEDQHADGQPVGESA